MIKHVLEPIIVDTPKRITALESAMLAITTEAGKVGYLYPAPKQALAKYVRELEAKNAEQAKTILDLAEMLAEHEQADPSYFWSNEADEVYNE